MQWGIGVKEYCGGWRRLAGGLAQARIGEPIDNAKQNQMAQGEMGGVEQLVVAQAGHVMTCLFGGG